MMTRHANLPIQCSTDSMTLPYSENYRKNKKNDGNLFHQSTSRLTALPKRRTACRYLQPLLALSFSAALFCGRTDAYTTRQPVAALLQRRQYNNLRSTTFVNHPLSMLTSQPPFQSQRRYTRDAIGRLFPTSTASSTVIALRSSASASNSDDKAATASTSSQSSQQQRLNNDGMEFNTDHSADTVTKVDENTVFRSAIQRTLAWVGAALAFGAGVWTFLGPQAGQEFFAGYLVEQSLSVDNLFVFLLLFEYFKVPIQYQDRVLTWGIFGAIVMRAVMISLGAVALQQYHAILLVFASVLVYSSAKFFLGDDGDDEDSEQDPGQNSIVQFAQSLFPSVNYFDGDRFFTTVEDNVRKATPLLICLIAVEISDVVFAVDSIPAVFGVTENPLIVFSSNMFAIMGLRSLYTILSKAATELKYLEPAVALVLGFIGCKMIAEYFGYEIPTTVALGVVATVLGTGIGASVWVKRDALPIINDQNDNETNNQRINSDQDETETNITSVTTGLQFSEQRDGKLKQ